MIQITIYDRIIFEIADDKEKTYNAPIQITRISFSEFIYAMTKIATTAIECVLTHSEIEKNE